MRTGKMRSPSQQEGFTLLEIIVVISIIALLGAIVAPNIIGKYNSSAITVEKISMGGVVKELKEYKVRNHNYPSTEQGLQALVSKPSGTPEPSGQWMQQVEKLPTDNWGNPYQYLNPGTHGDVDIISYGPDGRKSEDDIGSWDLK